MNGTLIVDIAAPCLAAAGVVASAMVGRRAGRNTAQAALTQADAAMEQAKAAETGAEATMHQGMVAERQAASADWARYVEAYQKYTEQLSERLTRVETRLGDAELRNIAAEMRAHRAESLYAVAIVYLRRIASWVTEHLPGETLPPPPPELEADL